MPVYQIVDLDIHNPELYARYVNSVADIVRLYCGRYLVRGGKVIQMNGDWHPQRLVVIEFENIEKLSQCYASPEYREIAPLREQSSRSNSIVVEGV